MRCFAAAALEPLANIDNQIAFRRESFLQRVAELHATERDGTEPACTVPVDIRRSAARVDADAKDQPGWVWSSGPPTAFAK